MGRASRAVWAKRVERWKDSGLTAKEFAAEIDVAPQTLQFWKWKLGREDGGPARATRPRRLRPPASEPPASAFLRLVPAAEPTATATALELVLNNGLIVRVRPSFDEPTLTRLVALFRGG
jgi:transposase